jgi:hypothetical protein
MILKNRSCVTHLESLRYLSRLGPGTLLLLLLLMLLLRQLRIFLLLLRATTPPRLPLGKGKYQKAKKKSWALSKWR